MGLFSSSKNPHFSAQQTVILTKDPAGTPAVSADTVKSTGNMDLVKQYEKAGFAVAAKGLSGYRFDVVAILDHSGSMLREYESGAVAKLLTRCLALGLQFDADGKVPVIPFDDQIRPVFTVNQTNFSTAVDQIWKRNDMGTTDMAGAHAALMEIVQAATNPVLAIWLCDGDPNSKVAMTKAICESAAFPVWHKFMALKPVDYLSELDDLGPDKRLLDNVDAKPEKDSDLNLLTCSDAEFHTAMVDELDTWITAATAAGVLKS